MAKAIESVEERANLRESKGFIMESPSRGEGRRETDFPTTVLLSP
jgi:hypothetical protein